MHSFDIQSSELCHAKRGVCRRCFAVFNTRDALDKHLTNPCEKVSRGKREKWHILHDTFTPLATEPSAPRPGQRTSNVTPVKDVSSGETSNPLFETTSTPSRLYSAILRNELFAQGLQAANDRHLSATPAPSPPREQSPFRQDSPLADWTKVSDLAEQRRIQNRVAQRNYRMSQQNSPPAGSTKVSDLAEQRRIQNRVAQRNYRMSRGSP